MIEQDGAHRESPGDSSGDSPACHFRRLRPAIVAIDGPAGSGKSTVGFRLAEQVNYLFFDTGVLYRAVTWAVLARNVPIHDEDAVAALARALLIDVAAPRPDQDDGRTCTVLVDGEDVTWQIRTAPVDQNVSFISAYAQVRQALRAQQRRIGQKYGSGQGDKAGVVMVGRDIGTEIMPDAGLKIYMEASLEERARRRYYERVARVGEADFAAILQDMAQRDMLDSGRAHSPLRAAADAVVIDTSNLSPDEVVARIVALMSDDSER